MPGLQTDELAHRVKEQDLQEYRQYKPLYT